MTKKARLLVPQKAPMLGHWTTKQRTELHDIKEDILTAVMHVADDRDWSNTHLAKEAGLSSGCVNDIFQGRTLNPALGTIVKLALACDLRVTVIEATLKIKRRGSTKLKLGKSA